MNETDLLYQVREGTGWITINRETRRNAISLGIMDLFFQYLSSAESDAQVRAVCITGSGDKAFCSGADLATSFEGKDYLAGAKKYATLLKRMNSFPKPLVARVNGNCLAGGLGLMLACDIVYAREEARFGTPELNVGLFPMMIAALIFRHCMRQKALEMIYTGRLLSAAEAEQMGLVTRVLAAAEFDRVIEETLKAIASKAPMAMRIGRQALASAQDMELGQALDFLCDRLGEVVATEDAKEGLRAFMEKRKPVWKGR
jgi:enoyl-CoA hydratase/carnithine racemase